MNFKNQKIIIVGGTSGVGLATAKSLVEANAEVVVTGRDEHKLENALTELGERASGGVFDATDAAQATAFFEKTGAFNHLILSASGAAGGGNFRELDLSELRRGFDAKFWAHATTAQAGLATLDKHGSIVFVTAISARTSQPGTAGLAAINGALESMIGALASELRPIRVNAVSPGVVDTPWWNKVSAQQKQALFEQLAAQVPVGRVGQPEDIAAAIVMLLSNGFMTGTILEVDGGWRLKN